MACERQPHEHSDDDDQAVIDQAETMLTDQADITHVEASRRIDRYARFQDLPLIDVSQAILGDTVHLRTLREDDNLARRTAAADRQ